MAPLKKAGDSVHWFLSELSSRIVAETGIPSDRHHLGKLILQSLKDAPEFVMQIDAATGRSENYRSVLERTVRCAESFKQLGLEKGDVIVLMATNSLDLAIPFYAALYLGVTIAALDSESTVVELENMFNINRGKIIFCQSARAPFVKTALKNIELDARVVTFGEGTDYIEFTKFLEQYGTKAEVATFRATDFDPAETLAMLTSTSGTTGLPKSVSLTHKNFVLACAYMWISFSTFPTPTKLSLVASPLQWLSASFQFLFSPILRYTRLQTSETITPDIFTNLVNTYRPTFTTVSPTLLMTLMKPGNREKCDLTCFEAIIVGGSAVPQELYDEMRIISPNTLVRTGYGLSEVCGFALYDEFPPRGSSGRPIGLLSYRLVNIETKEDINEPNVQGELWIQGATVFKGYYNNPAATAEVFEDGWVKSGDIFYRDENYFLYFVERMKLLLKYKSHQISPVEIEAVIRQHPSVVDVAVTGIPDLECGDLPVACVVPRKGHSPTAQEIKDLVKNTLAESKQLRGGVVFLSELPLTATTKLDRKKLKEIVLTVTRE